MNNNSYIIEVLGSQPKTCFTCVASRASKVKTDNNGKQYIEQLCAAVNGKVIPNPENIPEWCPILKETQTKNLEGEIHIYGKKENQ